MALDGAGGSSRGATGVRRERCEGPKGMPVVALAPKPDLAYFELTMSGPCALSIAESRDIGVYVPADVPGAYLELAILLPK
jgi:hypothetical protein